MGEDVHGTEAPASGSGTGAPEEDVWERLGEQLAELGTAIADAVRNAADDPDNRRRAREFKEGFDEMARRVGDSFSDVFSEESSQRVKEAAGAVAAAGRAVAQDVRPHLADFTRKAGEVLRDTASRMDPDREKQGEGGPGEPPPAV